MYILTYGALLRPILSSMRFRPSEKKGMIPHSSLGHWSLYGDAGAAANGWRSRNSKISVTVCTAGQKCIRQSDNDLVDSITVYRYNILGEEVIT